MAKKERARYSNHVKDQVRKRYGLCRTTADKQALADELGIGTVPKLYNLASRLGATGKEGIDETGGSEDSNLKERLLLRENPNDTIFSAEAERYLTDEFGRRTVEAISFHINHSETAVLYRARHMGLRLPVKHWNIVKVSAWLGFDVDDFRTLSREGLDIHPQHDPENGNLVLEVVSTTSLGRWLTISENIDRVEAQDADQFFLKEIKESMDDLVHQRTQFERCKFLSHGHVCQNPYAEDSFGLFCSNYDRQLAGEDPNCSVRLMAIEDLRPDTSAHAY